MRAWLFVLAACGHHAAAPSVQLHVDHRVETIAILEQLAGAPEYQPQAVSAYLGDVRVDLGAYASHPAVAATRALHDDRHLGFEQPMLLAVHLDDQLQISADAIADLRAQDARWRDVDVAAYAAQVRQFAADTRLEEFFAKHAHYIANVEQRFRTAVDAEDPAAWLAKFFGSDAARAAVRAKVEAIFPRAEVDSFTDLFFQRIQAWRKDNPP
jgi:hypothetical protein